MTNVTEQALLKLQ